MIPLSPLAEKVFVNMMSRMRACWEQGIVGVALCELEADDWLLAACDDMLTHQHKNGCLAGNGTSTQTDPALCIRPVMHAYALTGDERYKVAAERNLAYLLQTPWRSADGILYHFKNTYRLWADTAAMLPASLACMGHNDMAVQQLTGLCDVLRLPNGLYGHQWNDETKAWDRMASWSAGNGWILAGIAWTIQYLGKDAPAVPQLLDLYRQLTDALMPYRTEEGLYHDITDDPTTFVECQTAAMQTYSQLVLYDCGLWDATAVTHGQRVLAAISKHVDSHGAVQDTPGAPDFMHNGTSAEMQAFWLLLYARLSRHGAAACVE